MNKLILIYFLASFFTVSGLTRMESDGVKYDIITSSKTNPDVMVETFHDKFVSSVNTVYGKYNVKRPVLWKVVLCEDASSFSKLVKRPYMTGGLFVPGNEIFYFQNPVFLEKKSILKNIINHEVMHSAIFYLRKELNGYNSEEIHVTEEAFCTSLYPSGEMKGIFNEITLPESYDKFILWIKAELKAGNSKSQKKAYLVLQSWGDTLISKFGETAVVEFLTKGKNFENELLEKTYKIFKNNHKNK